jgi:hypothetical protein
MSASAGRILLHAKQESAKMMETIDLRRCDHNSTASPENAEANRVEHRSIN